MYTQPVIDFLASLGIQAKFEGKNDLKVNGLKISGNAEHVHRNRVLHHGTLLYDTSLAMLRNSLRKDTSCYTSRAVVSNPSSVTNLKDKLTGFKDIYSFRSAMMDYLLENMPEMATYKLSAQETEEAELLADSKYKSWDWNWAYGPEYQFIKQFESGGKKIFCRLLVKDGIILECVLEGSSALVNVGKKLIGCRHMVEDLRAVFIYENIYLSDIDIFNFF
jgi:lipoate-protein ligase A